MWSVKQWGHTVHKLITGVMQTNKKARNATFKVKNLMSESHLCGAEWWPESKVYLLSV